MKLMKLVIDRSRWLRGELNESYLIRESDGKMCCLGFLGLACEIPREHLIIAVPTPANTPLDCEKWPVKIQPTTDRDNTILADLLMSANDSVKINEKQREKILTKLFLQADIEVKFVNRQKLKQEVA